MSTGTAPCPMNEEPWEEPILSPKAKVLIISERSAERESTSVLVGTMGCQWALASAVEDALASIEAEKPSAVVLDLPNGISDPERLGQSFSELFRRSQG